MEKQECERLLFTRCATSNASRHLKSPLAMGRDAFKSKRASSVSISGVIDTGVNSNCESTLEEKIELGAGNVSGSLL